jgi:hypothetical protein
MLSTAVDAWQKNGSSSFCASDHSTLQELNEAAKYVTDLSENRPLQLQPAMA